MTEPKPEDFSDDYIPLDDLTDVLDALAMPEMTENDVSDLLAELPREDLITMIFEGVKLLRTHLR